MPYIFESKSACAHLKYKRKNRDSQTFIQQLAVYIFTKYYFGTFQFIRHTYTWTISMLDYNRRAYYINAGAARLIPGLLKN